MITIEGRISQCRLHVEVVNQTGRLRCHWGFHLTFGWSHFKDFVKSLSARSEWTAMSRSVLPIPQGTGGVEFQELCPSRPRFPRG